MNFAIIYDEHVVLYPTGHVFPLQYGKFPFGMVTQVEDELFLHPVNGDLTEEQERLVKNFFKTKRLRKFIKTEHGMTVFDSALTHRDVAGRNCTFSAGFVSCPTGVPIAEGRSESLNLGLEPEDSDLLVKFFNFEDTVPDYLK